MRIEKLTTQKIIGDWGSLERYARAKGISYNSLRQTPSSLTPVSKAVENQLEADGYGEYLKIDRQNMLAELNQKGVANGL